MHTDERRIYFALLTSGGIIILLIVFFVITIIRYQRRKVSAQLLTLQQEKQIQETVSSHIASDLHDEVNSGLSVIKLRLSFLSPNDAKQKQIIEDLSDYVDTLSDKVRSVSNQLLPTILETQGLQQALEELILPISSLPQYICEFRFALSVSPIPEVSIHIYRICQEIMSNVLKHSEATRIYFSLTETDNILFIHAEDNGKGFVLPLTHAQAGMGLRNIRTRADILRAKVYIETSAGNGTKYDIEIPNVYEETER